MGNFLTTTSPNPPVQDTNFTLSITDEFEEGSGTFQNSYGPYTLTLTGNTVYTSDDYAITNNGNTITFGGTTPINIPESGSITIRVEDDYSTTHSGSSNNIFNDSITLDPICYAEGTLILCLIDGIEKYVKVEELKKGMLVKTYNPEKLEYKKIFGVSKSFMCPSKSHMLSKLFVLRKNKMGENMPFEDLYMTGGHSYLVDSIEDESTLQFMEQCNPVFGAKIHDKYKMLTAFGKECEESKNYDPVVTYHFALEHEHEFGQYGVYANGALSESMSIHFFNKRKT